MKCGACGRIRGAIKTAHVLGKVQGSLRSVSTNKRSLRWFATMQAGISSPVRGKQLQSAAQERRGYRTTVLQGYVVNTAKSERCIQ